MYSQILFAAILDRIFFHTKPSALSFIGTIIIIGSALWVAVSDLYLAVPATSHRNQQFSNAKDSKPISGSGEDIALEEGLLQDAEPGSDKGWEDIKETRQSS